MELSNLDCFLRMITNKVEKRVISECINIAINNSSQDDKYYLVNSIIEWMNRFDIISCIVMYLLCTNSRVYTISAEIFGKGIEMRLRSQGSNVQVVEE